MCLPLYIRGAVQKKFLAEIIFIVHIEKLRLFQAIHSGFFVHSLTPLVQQAKPLSAKKIKKQTFIHQEKTYIKKLYQNNMKHKKII